MKEICELPLNALDVDMKAELIQALIPIGRWHVKEVLKQEGKQLAGERYKQGGLHGYNRWGKQGGSVYLGNQKLPIEVPRVRDQRGRKEVRLRSYEECAEAVPEAFGLRGSTVSRRFIGACARQLKKLCERRLEGYDFVALILDGKTFGDDEMVIALGVTQKGRKILLGFIQTGA